MATTNGTRRPLGAPASRSSPSASAATSSAGRPTRTRPSPSSTPTSRRAATSSTPPNGYSRWVPGHDGGESERVIGEWLDRARQPRRRDHRDQAGQRRRPDAGERPRARRGVARAPEDRLRRHHVRPLRRPRHAARGRPAARSTSSCARARSATSPPRTSRAERLEEAIAAAEREGFAPYEVLQPHYNLLERDYEIGLSAGRRAPRPRDRAVLRAREGLPHRQVPAAATGRQPARGADRRLRVNDRGWAVLDAVEEIAARARRAGRRRRARVAGRAADGRLADRQRAQHRAARASCCRWRDLRAVRRRAAEADGRGCLSRFAEPQDPVFRRLNTSLGFDRRLWPHDVRQSRAHARMLAGAGIISGEDRDALLAALDEVEARAARRPLRVPARRRGHPHGGRAAGHGDRRPAGRPAAHGALAQRPGRHRRRALHARRGRRARRPAIEALAATLLDVAERHLDWALPGYTHLQRAQPVYLAHHLLAYVVDAPARPRADALRRRADRHAAARRGRAGGRELLHRPRCGGARSSASRASRRTRSTPSPTATSSSTT